MSVYMNTMAKFAFAHAIAANQIKAMEDTDPNLQPFMNLATASFGALKRWPGRAFNRHDMSIIDDKLKLFVAKVNWDYAPVHIQSMINFSLFQMVDLIENHIKDEVRRGLVYRIGEAAQLIYDAYSAAPDMERPICIAEGLHATKLWAEIIEG